MKLKFQTQEMAEAEVERLTSALATILDENKALTARATELTGRQDADAKTIETLTADKTALSARITELEASAKDVDARIEKEASNKALAIVASQGAANPLPAGAVQQGEDFVAAYKAETDPRKKALLLEKNLTLARKLAFAKS